MKIIKIFKTRKLFLLNLFLTLYVAINLIGGERGLISYFEKKNIENQLKKKEIEFSKKLKILENKNTLLSTNLNLDFLDTLYREKLKFGKKNEVLIKIK